MNTQNNHNELMSELTNVMQFYWVELDRYSTIRNFNGNLINIRQNIPTLLPSVMAGNRSGPPLREYEEDNGIMSVLAFTLAELRDGFIY
jgi:hypothetical protein